MLILIFLFYYLKVQRNIAFEDGINIIWKCIENVDVMGDINYHVRMLELKGKGIYKPRNETDA